MCLFETATDLVANVSDFYGYCSRHDLNALYTATMDGIHYACIEIYVTKEGISDMKTKVFSYISSSLDMHKDDVYDDIMYIIETILGLIDITAKDQKAVLDACHAIGNWCGSVRNGLEADSNTKINLLNTIARNLF